MSRAETTAMLSKLVEKRLKNRVSYWASEVNFEQAHRLHRIQAFHARLRARTKQCGTRHFLLL